MRAVAVGCEKIFLIARSSDRYLLVHLWIILLRLASDMLAYVWLQRCRAWCNAAAYEASVVFHDGLTLPASTPAPSPCRPPIDCVFGDRFQFIATRSIYSINEHMC